MGGTSADPIPISSLDLPPFGGRNRLLGIAKLRPYMVPVKGVLPYIVILLPLLGNFGTCPALSTALAMGWEGGGRNFRKRPSPRSGDQYERGSLRLRWRGVREFSSPMGAW